METLPTDQRCSRCGAVLPADAPLGACPACLLAVAAQPASEITGGLTADASDAVSSGAYANDPARFVPGDRCGSYEIVKLMGRGGMGEVYEAIGADGRHVALKLLRERLTGRVDRERFFREGVLAASVTHRNCVYVYGSEEIDGLPVIAMELAPQGTLKQSIEQFGPRTPAQAVRDILQVIAGLEAAAAAGILHRDVKPSNCFIDADGGIKIGDFGLSMSLHPADGDVSWKPAFQGTPEFAAPEQLRGEPLDVRADIYGVGATLFFLLTGYSPFGERNIAKLIALKTAKPAPDTAAYLPDIPTGLTTLVGRCMSPDPNRRPQTYADLRAQLLPFITPAPASSSISRRAAALWIDSWAAQAIAPILAAIRLLDDTDSFLIIPILLSVVYFAVFERLIGATPGKWLLGIRVVTAGGQRPTLAVCAARWAIALGPLFLPRGLIAFGLMDASDRVYLFIAIAAPLLAVCSALYAQTRNDRAMFHDVWTGTRVIRMQPRESVQADRPQDRERTGALATSPADVDRAGPFDVIGKIADTPVGDLLLARDPQLRRFVWIHRRPSAPGALPAVRRQLAQRTRLRWLAGDERWDAFEVPDGRAFRQAAGRRDWRRISGWLADLSRDFEAAEAAGVLPVLATDHLWLLDSGGLMMLDFRAPGAAGEPDHPDVSAPSFLARLLGNPGDSGRVPRNVALVQRALAGEWMTTRAAAGILQQLAHAPLEFTRFRRALPILICALPAIVGAAGSWLQEVSARERFNGPDAALRLVLQKMSPSDELTGTPETRARLRLFVAESFRAELAQGERFWDTARGRSFSAYRAAIEHSVQWYVAKTPEEALAARAAAEAFANAERARALPVHRPELSQRLKMLSMSMSTSLVLLAIISFATSFVATPFLFRTAGLALEDAEGLDAPLVRRVARAALTWCPLLLLGLSPWLPVAILAAGALYAIASPERSFQDRLAGTYVAPR